MKLIIVKPAGERVEIGNVSIIYVQADRVEMNMLEFPPLTSPDSLVCFKITDPNLLPAMDRRVVLG